MVGLHFYMKCDMIGACHCSALRWGVALVGEFPLLGIAQPVVGKYFQVLGVHGELNHIKDLSVKKRPNYGLFYGFVTFWIEYLVLYMYMRSFVIKTYFWTFSV